MAVGIGIRFDGFAATRDSLAVVREAEAAGATQIWMAEHMGYREAVASSMAYALSTRNASIVPTAVSPYMFHPMPTAMALATGILPPTINQKVPDPECDLDVITNVARAVDVDVALCNCLGFGSKNSALVLKKYP